MPIYDFFCEYCDRKFESLIFPNDPMQCPTCKTTEVNRLPSVIGGYTAIKNNGASERPKGAGSRPKSTNGPSRET